MSIDLAAFDKAHPELGPMSSDTPNADRFEEYILMLMSLEFNKKWDEQTLRFEAIKHKRLMFRLQRRSLAPRMRSRAFRLKQIHE